MKKEMFLTYAIIVIVLGSALFLLTFANKGITGNTIFSGQTLECTNTTIENCTTINNETVCENQTIENCTEISFAPTVSIISPGEEEYPDTEEIILTPNVTSDDLDSCWYTLGETSEIVSCEDSTNLGTLEAGTYTLILYANNTQGEESSSEVDFSIVSTEARIEITPDQTTYTNTPVISIEYTPLYFEPQSCELLIIEGENSTVDQTNENVTEGETYEFEVEITGNENIMKVRCLVSNENYEESETITAILDTNSPTISITWPSNGESFTDDFYELEVEINEDNPEVCRYIVTKDGSTFMNNTFSCSSTIVKVNVGNNTGSFTTKLHLTDKAGNTGETTITLTRSSGEEGTTEEEETQEANQQSQESTQVTEENYYIPPKKIEPLQAAETPKTEVNLGLVGIERAEGNNLTLFYAIRELSGLAQTVLVKVLITQPNNAIDLTEERSLTANELAEYNTTITTEEYFDGLFNLTLTATSGEFTITKTKEDLTLEGEGFTGFAILDNIGLNGTNSIILGGAILGLLLIVMIMRKVIETRSNSSSSNKPKKKVIENTNSISSNSSA